MRLKWKILKKDKSGAAEGCSPDEPEPESEDEAKRGRKRKKRKWFASWAGSPKEAKLNRYSLLIHALLACVLVFVIEWMSRHSFTSAIEYTFGTPLRFLYNAFLVFASFLFVYLFRHRALVRVILTVFWVVLGVINGVVLANRVTPFNFADLSMLSDLLDMRNSKYLTVAQEILILIALAAVLVFLVFLAIRGPKFSGKIHRIRNAVCLGVVVVSIPVITQLCIQSDILSGYFGNLAQGYEEYGFVYSFAASVVDTGMSKPDDYSEETIEEINDSIETEGTTIDTDNLPNIIFVQLESFIDPYELNFLEYSEDPIPNFRSLMENYTSGYLTVPVVGAGTANTEFEVLTGMGIQFFGLGEYPYKTILKETAVESAATALSSIGYNTAALHNNSGNFYSRATIFSQMGFDSYTSKELMDITEYNILGTWAADSILVEETVKILDSSEDQADFVFAITVQSHGSYPTYEVYEDPVIEVSGAETEEEAYQWEYYINQLYEVDQFIGDLIETLSEREEDTLVVFYGDHYPTMGLTDEDVECGNLYLTTYATWNNFGLEKEDADLAAYQLLAYFTDQLGISEGTMFTFHQSALNAGTTDTEEYVTEWELLQYDLLYGEHYTYGGEQIYVASDLIMGVSDVVISSIEVSAEDSSVLILTGENFTAWSKVYVNGESVDTEYISGTQLSISASALSEGDTVVVNQVGSSNTIFRSSNETVYSAGGE